MAATAVRAPADLDAQQARRFRDQRAVLCELHGFYGPMSLQLRNVHQTAPDDATIDTAATDGTDLWYSPTYTATLTDGQLRTLIAHETGHPALGHIWRAAQLEDHTLANQAADYVLNGHLLRDGFEPLPRWLHDNVLSGPQADFETVYAILRRNKREEHEQGQPSGKPGQSNGPQAPGNTPDLLAPAQPDPNTPAQPGTQQAQPGAQPAQPQQPMTAADWQLAAEQTAMVDSKWGRMPGSAKLAIDAYRKPQLDWRAVLARFVEQHARQDYSWATPNRRYLAVAGLYMPGIRSDSTPPVVVCFDTSGSVGTHTRTAFVNQIKALLADAKPERIHVIYADDDVQRVDTFDADQTPTFEPIGGGGTSFGPALAKAAEIAPDACCCIYLTDADGSDNAELTAPPFPVLWALAPHARRTLPFGEHIKLREG